MKKFTLHLDAAIVIALLVALSLGMNAYQYIQYKSLKDENYRLQLQGLEDRLNLDSQQSHIIRQNSKIEQLEAAVKAAESGEEVAP